MKLQLIRNATLRLAYAGRVILIDPYFAPKHSLPSYAGRSNNPLVDLPMPVEAILQDVNLVIVSHLHSDHFDSVARARLPKDMPILCQPGDEETLRSAGFVDVTPLATALHWNGITITRRDGSHGLGAVLAEMGSVMGFSLTAAGEPHLYWLGDTVLYPPVLDTIRQTAPEVIVSHACGAYWGEDLIVMDAAQTVALCEAAPLATVVATHMDSLDHATVSRADLRAAAKAYGLGDHRLRIPADAEEIMFPAPR
ncbi:L-ascorbate metabolism protein UlaG, beta-lactamase superfamily [Rhizobium sp. RU35A]|uniref:MBL fold metallo-hydrolase n=1 Tax=Rhizobium sp. RU35A TaxID=1907414 RepID=UPI0009550465|nr:MBL fold metallo-hydrolase [Rhizobium sp. RU35A]SIQ15518.1 L-ascorbate metabolism protein UlaG, beta-lactamase superfamily [Rhizobium sp. RU35A]